MKIVVHDYAGHPFQVELSRSLARRGHQVEHLFSSSFLTPQGALQKTEDDPESFRPVPIVLEKMVAKGNLMKRRQADIRHGQLTLAELDRFRPEVVLSANTPLDAQKQIIAWCRDNNARFVFWVQDLIGQAALRILGSRFPLIGGMVGSLVAKHEEALLRQSDAIVVISSDFLDYIPQPARARATVIENWAPLADMPVRSRSNAWAKAHDLEGGINFVYTGTIALKHNHELLLALAQALLPMPEARVVVVSEGAKARLIEEQSKERGLKNLRVMPFQPFRDLPDVLGSSDVLMAVLEEEAGVFSVPSKVLTCLCASRPLLLAVPAENLAARIVSTHGAGLVSQPNDVEAFVRNGLALAADSSLREAMGRKGRAYAEAAFDIEAITEKFLPVLMPQARVSSAA